ncbi:hypothetical protein Taro_051500 [Colocasia esculenta]|uniref:Uncharacterized protein n=1 Tax=Colocasia esculenta TaxID=4460 RepID=A0A843XGR2_COLES|nr:hypothetical protein [Colocasia esculenta]
MPGQKVMPSSFTEGVGINNRGWRSRVELNTTSDLRDRPTPCVVPASDSHNRGRRYCQKTLESGRSSARITISECE